MYMHLIAQRVMKLTANSKRCIAKSPSYSISNITMVYNNYIIIMGAWEKVLRRVQLLLQYDTQRC